MGELITTTMGGSAAGTIGGNGTSVTTYNTNNTRAASCHGTGKGSWFN